ncbi:MAG: hypothetical protein H6574_05540 [Lewinellaceae bacterium]|nr:hypothetical protein [Saprospiraceae bacterium]MCB9330525.1 hypothetical protein [Lewinellaceae bacterium]
MNKLLLILSVCFFSPAFFSAQDATKTIRALTDKMDRVKDYSVNAKIKSDIPLIKSMPVKAVIYFKQKDKFRIVADGIAILPKQDFNDISQLLRKKESYNALSTGNATIQNMKTEELTILPKSDTADLILAKLWVDTDNAVILKSQVTSRSNGTVTTEYTYGAHKKYGLPDAMVFTVDVKKFKIPKGVATDINRNTSKAANKPVPKTGQIDVRLSNYKINKGIDDAVFTK